MEFLNGLSPSTFFALKKTPSMNMDSKISELERLLKSAI